MMPRNQRWFQSKIHSKFIRYRGNKAIDQNKSYKSINQKSFNLNKSDKDDKVIYQDTSSIVNRHTVKIL